MKLPKIKKEDLPEELQSIIDGDEIEFDPIVSVDDIFDLPFDHEEYEKGRIEIAQKLVESRKKLEDARVQQRKLEKTEHPE
jgi:hypothetical protein